MQAFAYYQIFFTNSYKCILHRIAKAPECSEALPMKKTEYHSLFHANKGNILMATSATFSA